MKIEFYQQIPIKLIQIVGYTKNRLLLIWIKNLVKYILKTLGISHRDISKCILP